MPSTSLRGVLIESLIPALRPRIDSRVLSLVRVAAGVLLLTLLAQIRLQLGPVPFTGQTLGVLLLGAAYGVPLGSVTMLTYLLLGALGMPLFAGGESGFAYLLGPTGGYLVGFVLAALLLGYLARRGWDRNLASCALAMALANLIIYLPGLTWLKLTLGLSWPATFAAGFTPFWLGDLVKLAIAAAALPAAWRLLGRRGRV